MIWGSCRQTSVARANVHKSTCRVSAVSPDWLTKTQVSSRKMGHRRSHRSDASSRATWDVGQLLHRLPRGQAGVEGGAAGDEDDAPPAFDGRQVVGQAAKLDVPLRPRVTIGALQSERPLRRTMARICEVFRGYGSTFHDLSSEHTKSAGTLMFRQCSKAS